MTVKAIHIDVRNLSVKSQLQLLSTLYTFAYEKLPTEVMLNISLEEDKCQKSLNK